MITQYNNSNAERYNKLFADASQALGTADSYTPVAIGSANEYYNSILDGVQYYIDPVYTVTSDEIGVATDFYAKSYYIKKIDDNNQDKYERVFQFISGEVYYEVEFTPIAINEDGKPAEFDENETYYINTSSIESLEQYFC